jgi:hypothetical protein
MSVQLYKQLLEWFIKYGTIDGLFAHCYLVLSWNLACRVGNTARIAFKHIVWSQSFDSFTIAFSQTKTDQLGIESKYPRHLYANPLNPLVCPVLSLALYLSSCFNITQHSDGYLFPGPKQAARFAIIMNKAINDNWERVSQMGYIHGDLGTHSIRKGAVSYIASLPQGPPDAAVCIRAGWTKGKIKDVYMRYVSNGDEFVGRCVSLLSMLREDFAVSPPHFSNEDFEWIEPTRLLQFPMVASVIGFQRMTRMCLASLLYHNSWLSSYLQPNHIIFNTCYCFRSAEILSHHRDVIITYPWNDENDHAFSGIPPTIALLQHVCSVKEKQERMVSEFVEETSELFRRFEGGRLSEQSVVGILEDFQRRFMAEIGTARAAAVPAALPEAVNDQPEMGRRYMVHFYGGGIHRLPKDWRFPRCGVFDLWRQWMIGNDVRNIPPLSDIKSSEYTHLDKLPLSDEERHGRTGGNSENRRPSRKILSEMRSLMKFVHDNIVERGAWRAEITPSSVDAMFFDIVDVFTEQERDAQILWNSALKAIKRRLRNNAINLDEEGNEDG